MPRNDRSLLGIELHEREIRVVQVRYRSNKPYISKVGWAPMPPGAVARGHVMHGGSVAIALRRLLDDLKVGTTNAVVGISGDRTVTRTFNIPPCPDSELGTIVGGEVDHYNMVHTPGAAWSYIRLSPPTRGAEAEPIPVTVVAVEEDTTSAIRDGIERSGLTIDALEPLQFAMLRATMLAHGTDQTVFALMLGGANSEIAFIYNGHIVAYRRIDVGSRALMQAAHSPAAAVTINPFDPGAPVDEDDTALKETSLDHSSVENLATETRRTLDYFQREYPDFALADKLYVALDDVATEPVVDALAHQLGIPVEAVRPAPTGGDSPDVTLDTAGAEGLRYVAAYGLAMHDTPQTKLPRIDLFSAERSAARQSENKRNFLGSIVVSAAAVLIGAVGYYLYNNQITTVEGETKVAVAKAAQIKSETNLTLQERATRAKQYKALRHEGVPISVIMDYLVGSLEPGTGLKEVTVDKSLNVGIEGEALQEANMIKTVQNLQGSPVLTNLMINNFKRQTATQGGITFQVNAQTVTMDRVRLPGEGGNR